MSIHARDDGAPNTVTYLFTDNNGNRLEELPLTQASFSLALCASGQFAGTLNVEDPRVRSMAWVNATAPNLTQVWVDINGVLVYGGRVTKRTYTKTTGQVQIQGMDHWSYLAQLLQALDYSTQWASTPAGAAQIAHQVIVDALNQPATLPIAVTNPPATPSTFRITMAAPITQRMTIDSMVQQLTTLGWQVGFDFAVDVAYVTGIPVATLTLSYPRRGRVAGSTGLTLDLSQSLELVWDEDGTQQADSVTETATGMGGVATTTTWPAAMSIDGYPLLQKAASHASFSSTALSSTVLQAFAADDLALAAYPVVTPQVTMPMFAEPSIGEWIVGDDVRLISPASAGAAVTVNPRFPKGLDVYMRITRADCTIPTEGVPTVQYTFNLPYSSTPQRPPQ